MEILVSGMFCLFGHFVDLNFVVALGLLVSFVRLRKQFANK